MPLYIKPFDDSYVASRARANVDQSTPTAGFDPFRQGVELTQAKHYTLGIVKIHGGNGQTGDHTAPQFIYGQSQKASSGDAYYKDLVPTSLVDFFERTATTVSQVIDPGTDLDVDKYLYDGVIEPFDIRSVVARKPERLRPGHKICGALEEGNVIDRRSSEQHQQVAKASDVSVGAAPMRDVANSFGDVSVTAESISSDSRRVGPFNEDFPPKGTATSTLMQADMTLAVTSMAPGTVNALPQGYVRLGSAGFDLGPNIGRGSTFAAAKLRRARVVKELREQDQQPGARPSVSRTGDRTRTGRSKVYFSDERTVAFITGTNVVYPTTFQQDPTRVAPDLTGTLGPVAGNVSPSAVDQFVKARPQTESPGPFVEDKLFEQDEHAVVNSSFMTGAAFGIAPDRFKSPLSAKTVVRMDFPLTAKSPFLATTSSMLYLNPERGAFEVVGREQSYNLNGGGVPSTFAPVMFTPYGFHYLPLNDYASNDAGAGLVQGARNAPSAYRRVTTYAGDGSDGAFYENNDGYTIGYVTASVMNERHTAALTQSVTMRTRLSDPFLLEKVVVEFPLEAGPGWLNDCFGSAHSLQDDLTYTVDAGGPMITFALMRQDKSGRRHRDLIASGTITTANDMRLGSYKSSTMFYAGVGGTTDNIFTHEGVAGMLVNPSVIVTGSSAPTGSNNYFTGTIKLVMDPQVTTHVMRLRVSGSNFWVYGRNGFDRNQFGVVTGPSSGSNAIAHRNQAFGMVFGPITRRSTKFMEAGRSVLGNHFALMSPDSLDGALYPLTGVDSQYENLQQDIVAPRNAYSKIFSDIVSKTIKSPYLLYPDDDLVLCFSKHRACATDDPNNWAFYGSDEFGSPVIASGGPTPLLLSKSHDVALGVGSFKLTLYGDLLREEKEFHDTLNQRLETSEVSEVVGNDPVLDSFDVAYSFELSGSHLDRNNIFAQVPYMAEAILTASSASGRVLNSTVFDFARDVGHFSNDDGVNDIPWSTIGYVGDASNRWTQNRYAHELRKSSRNKVFTTDNELFWDTRIPVPPQAMAACNTAYLLTHDPSGCQNMATAYSGNESDLHDMGSGTTGNGILDWYMTYPYEPRYENVAYTFYSDLGKDVFRTAAPGAHSVIPISDEIDYNTVTLEIGSIVGSDANSHRFLASEGVITNTRYGIGYAPLRKPEFIKFFFGIGDGVSEIDNQHVRNRSPGVHGVTANIRGWRYGMMNAFQTSTTCVFSRNHFGHFRDMLEQRPDSKFYTSNAQKGVVAGAKDGPVQVRFFDQVGRPTPALRTLSSNLSMEATSSMPYTDGVARNRPPFDDNLNIINVVV